MKSTPRVITDVHDDVVLSKYILFDSHSPFPIPGPEEDIPRSMEVIDFVSHSPQSRHFQTSYFHNLEQAELWKH